MRHLRTVTALLLFLALIVLAAVAALSFWVTPERVAQRVANALETHLGLRIEYSAALTLKRLPELEVTLPGSSLVRAADGERLGGFSAAMIRLKPWAIFAGSPRVDHILVDGLDLTLAPGTPASAEQARRLSGTYWDVALMELRNSAVTLSGEVFGSAPVRISALEARLENMSEAGGVVRAAGNLDGAALSGAATLSGAFRFTPDAATAELLPRLVLDSPAFTIDGLWRSRSVHAELNAASLAPDQAGWRLTAPALKAVFADGASWRVSAPEAALTAGSLSTERASASLTLTSAEGTLSAEGSAKLDWRASPAALTLTAIDLTSAWTPQGTQAAAAASRLTGSLSTAAGGAARADLQGTLFGTSVRISAASETSPDAPRAQLKGEVRLGVVDPAIAAALPWRPEWLGFADFEGALSVDGFGPAAGFSTLSAEAKLADGALSLAHGTGEWLGGRLDFAGFVARDGLWKANLKVRGARAEAWATALGRPAALSGRVDGALDLGGALSPEPGRPRISEASGDFTVADGAFAGFNIPLAHKIMVEETPDATPPEVRQPQSTSAFDELSFRTALESDAPALRITDGRVKAEAWTADFTGVFTRGRLTLTPVIHLPAEEKVPAFDLAAALETDGSAVPVWRADWAGAARVVAEARSGEPFSLDAFGRRIERAIKDFWQGLELPQMELPKFELPDWKLPKMPWQKDETAPAAPQHPVV